MEKLYKVAEAAKILGITRKTIYNHHKNGKVKLVEQDGNLKMKESDLTLLKTEVFEFYNISEAAKILGVSRWTIYYAEKQGNLKFTNINGFNKVSAEDIKRLKEIKDE